MPGFPLASDETDSQGRTVSIICPYSPQEIRTYLHNCHYHLALQEEPMEFGELRFLCERTDTTRLMWIWECGDPLGRNWWIVIGSGRSPGGGHPWRWMYAEIDGDFETGAAYLEHAWQDIEQRL
jgi:hypothetical protein